MTTQTNGNSSQNKKEFEQEKNNILVLPEERFDEEFFSNRQTPDLMKDFLEIEKKQQQTNKVDLLRDEEYIKNFNLSNSISSQILREESATVLDQWYVSGESIPAIEPILAKAREKNKKPSELIREDANFAKMINIANIFELIPEADRFSKNNDLQQSFIGIDDSGVEGNLAISIGNFDNKIIDTKGNKNLEETKQQANLTLSLVNQNNINSDYLQIAEDNNIPPSIIMTENTDLMKVLDQFKNTQLDTNLDTPITFHYMGNASFAANYKDHVKEIQDIETNIKQSDPLYWYGGLAFENEQDRLNSIHSENKLDDLKYGIIKPAVALVSAANWLLKHSPLDIELGGSRLSGYADRSLVDWSNMVENMPRSVKKMARMEEIVADKDGGVLPAIGYLFENYDLVVDIFLQEGPSMYLGSKGTASIKYGGGLATKLKTVGGAALGTYFSNSTKDIADAYAKTNDVESAVSMGQKKTLKTSAISGLVPMLPKLNTSSAMANHLVNSNVSGAFTYVAGNFVNGEDISWDGIITALILNNASAVSTDLAFNKAAWQSLGRDIKSRSWQAMGSTPFVQNYRKEASQFINMVYQNLGLSEYVYISVQSYVKQLTLKGKDPYKLTESITGDKKYVDNALITGGYIKLTKGDYITRVIPLIGAKALEKDIKTSPNGMTYNESISALQHAEKYLKINQDENELNLKSYNKYLKDFKKQGMNQHAAENNAFATFSVDQTLSKAFGLKPNGIALDYSIRIKENSSKPIKDSSNGRTNKHFVEIDKRKKSITFNLDSEITYDTYLKDTSKLYINGLVDATKTVRSDSVLLKEISALRNYLKTNDITDLTVRQQKELVGELKNYLNTGKLSDSNMKPVFDRYKQWAGEFYQTTRQLKPNFDTEVEQKLGLLSFMDTAVDILNAPYVRLFTDAQQAGMSKEEFMVYENHQNKIKQTTKDKIFHQQFAQLTQKKIQQWSDRKKEVKQKVTIEEEKNTIYKVRDFLTKGILKDGSKGKIVKLDEAELVKLYGEDILKQLPNLTQKNGVSLKHVTDLWDFKSHEDLLIGLIYSKDKKANIEAKTNAIMQRDHDKLVNHLDTIKTLRKSLENEDRSKALELEEKILLKKSLAKDNQPFAGYMLDEHISSDGALRAKAKDFLKGQIIQEQNLDIFLSVMQRESQKAAKALKEGKLEQALQAKRTERFNHILYLYSLDMIENESRMKKTIDILNNSLAL
ncbi:hypothetical protein [Entomomonas asaccharolytica]|uniref:Uncharacterized protein n=1 Tax=Entomomonas asaccharolytica TaxID=2785331 RepID=A0A974NDX0_9GAMM|nr:hypothetical protein [Entomomonas asaccharolytica]QQP84699.1 hypothetical protein JHT90_09790 [Entomomonas asaccharolytica]